MTDVASDMNNTELPDTIDFTNSDVDRDVAQKKLKPATCYQFKVGEAEKGASKNKGTLFLKMRVNPLDIEGNTRGPSTYYTIWLPFENKNVAGHQAPNTLWACHSFLSATYPKEYPTYPTVQADGSWITADGQVVDKNLATSIKKEIAAKVRTRFQQYWQNPEELVGEVFFGVTDVDDYRNVDKVGATPLNGMDVCYKNFAE